MFGAIMALLSMTSCNNGNSSENVTSTLSFDEVLTSRRSVRNYDASKKITEAEVRDLIKAAQEAEGTINPQVFEKEKLDYIMECVRFAGIGLMTWNWYLVKTAYRLFMAQNELIETAIKFYRNSFI